MDKTTFTTAWNPESWLLSFHAPNADYRGLRKLVWENTLRVVKDGGYILPDGTPVSIAETENKRLITGESYMQAYTKLYSDPVYADCEENPVPTQITVVSDDCLDTAHKWVEEGLSVTVLNMANRQNPGGGVIYGAGAQEEYLFRCSNYYLSLFQFVHYAHMYGCHTRNDGKYPLDRDYGGIYTPEVTIFRANEKNGYALIQNPWKVNMIAVAGMNHPELETINGKSRIIPRLAEGVKNKIRTIFRIALDNNQRNLVLGAIGCGAFGNPPEHVAELFRDVLCEPEFRVFFNRICFAVKTDHNSNGSANYTAFKNILDGFIPD